ncbi:Protein split ends [Folsomia candida]|uniref:Protein split ends n=1 Tax=Folsomia candida TaxID=158441 RepID=A0A226D9N3_FOLCA|nr:Protein split ends [Folsomia candida]
MLKLDGEESRHATGEEQQGKINPPAHLTDQVAPKVDTLLTVLQSGITNCAAVKNNTAASQMHYLTGDQDLAREALAPNPDGTIPPATIARNKIGRGQWSVESTWSMGPRDIASYGYLMPREHCVLLALPCGRDREDVLRQSNHLRREFITYFQLKEAAGIANIPCPLTGVTKFVIHLIPADCGFVFEYLRAKAPDLLQVLKEIPYLMVVIASV